MKKHTLHSHTTYSDGELEPKMLIDELVKRDYKIVGISDHGFTKKILCVDERNLWYYIEDLRKIQSREKRLELKIGLEVDVSFDTGKRLYELPFKKLNKLDFVLLENVAGLENTQYGPTIYDIANIRNTTNY